MFTPLNKALDVWSDKIIKNSILRKALFIPTNLLAFSSQYKFFSRIIYISLIVSIGILFGSLSLPQFASDRFGIGLMILFCFSIFAINIYTNNFFFKFNSIDFLLLAFLFIACISTFSSYFFKESLVGLFKYLVYFLWYLLIKGLLLNSSKKNFIGLWNVLIVIATITSSIGIYQYIIGVEPLATWEDPTSDSLHTRVYSTLGNPNLLAGYLIGILPISIAMQFEKKISLLNRLLNFLSSIIILLCLIFTGSRGAYLGLFAGLGFSLIVCVNYLGNKLKKKKRVVAFCGLFALLIIISSAVLFLFPVVAERISTIFTLRENTSNSYRVNVWLSCLQMLKDNWLIGIGPGNSTFRLAYGLYMISGFDALAAYNIFLEIAIELGIVGFLIFSLIVLISFLKLHALFWNEKNIFALGIFISIVSLLTHGVFDTVFFRPQVFIPFWFLLASIGKIESEPGK